MFTNVFSLSFFLYNDLKLVFILVTIRNTIPQNEEKWIFTSKTERFGQTPNLRQSGKLQAFCDFPLHNPKLSIPVVPDMGRLSGCDEAQTCDFDQMIQRHVDQTNHRHVIDNAMTGYSISLNPHINTLSNLVHRPNPTRKTLWKWPQSSHFFRTWETE